MPFGTARGGLSTARPRPRPTGPPPLVLALELEQALVFGGPGRGLGGDAGLAIAFDPAGERGASQVVFRHQLASRPACEVELHDLPPELLRELPGIVGVCHCRAFPERFLSPSPNCLTKCSKSIVEPVVGGERVEGPGGAYGAADAPADARGVVEHDPCRHPSHVPEHLLQGLADAIRVLRWEHLGEPHVGVRGGQREEAEPPAHAVDVEVRLAEVGLGLAGSLDELEVAVGGRAALPAHLRGVVAHGGLAARHAVLVAQPLPDPSRGVAPLAPLPRVLVEPGGDHAPVGVEHPVAPPAHRDWRR